MAEVGNESSLEFVWPEPFVLWTWRPGRYAVYRTYVSNLNRLHKIASQFWSKNAFNKGLGARKVVLVYAVAGGCSYFPSSPETSIRAPPVPRCQQDQSLQVQCLNFCLWIKFGWWSVEYWIVLLLFTQLFCTYLSVTIPLGTLCPSESVSVLVDEMRKLWNKCLESRVPSERGSNYLQLSEGAKCFPL